ncbi:MAG: agmatine deiminase family protein [Planctomycetaceae bacterium]|nr:agmatine deiminase family protein [Planctomycetaceae bacterium]
MLDCGDSPCHPVDDLGVPRAGRCVGSLVLVAMVMSLSTTSAAQAEDRTWSRRPQPSTRILPAEFSRQEGVLITWDANDEGMQEAMIEIVSAAWQHVSFYILVPNLTAEGQVVRELRARNVPRRAVKFLNVPTDSVWTRDFGPQVVLQRNGGSCMVDCDYGHGDRVGDDLVPAAIAPTLGMSTLRPPITADGGNIQTNGRGLALTTTSILDHNVDRRYTPEKVSRVFRDYYGIEDLVFLEPLAGESTGHVDMFAVFVSEDTVVVGQYDPRQDPVNSELLERNVARLQRVRGPDGAPLRIVRVPMPPHDEKVWRTYTNVLFANGTLLVPKYPQLDPHGHSVTVAAYRKLLPGWNVIGIDCSRIIEWGGAIHCMTMNLARIPGAEEDRRDESLDPPPSRLLTRNDLAPPPDHDLPANLRDDLRSLPGRDADPNRFQRSRDDLTGPADARFEPAAPRIEPNDRRFDPAIASPADSRFEPVDRDEEPQRFTRPHRRQRVRDRIQSQRSDDWSPRRDDIRARDEIRNPDSSLLPPEELAPRYDGRPDGFTEPQRSERPDDLNRETMDDESLVPVNTEIRTAGEFRRSIESSRTATPPRSMFLPGNRLPGHGSQPAYEPFAND